MSQSGQGFRFERIRKDGGCDARTGRLVTAHGTVDTPAFMPVGTQGALKALLPSQAEALGVEMILANTYHLYLRPGSGTIGTAGGLHRFMGWSRPILTDSGGFQVHSLAKLRRITPEGVLFQSHIDGSRHLLTPETALAVQETIGSDIMMCLDECTPYPCSREDTEASLKLTTDWAARSRRHRRADDRALFGIVQGGVYPELRRRAAEELVSIGFDGYAVGGVSVGEPRELMYEITGRTAPLLPEDRPRYLMGVGTPEDIVRCIGYGIDMFDCVLPTRCARHGLLFTNGEKVVIKHARYRDDQEPLDRDCDCHTCRNFSRAYLRHLFVAGEILALVLNTIHNVRHYIRLMERIRRAVAEDRYADFQKEFLNRQGG
ncbi:MAG: Queuine tRNA-ribosyltransferase [Syntrophaceae bacterium PtaU1.Bin231]|nr:MAG: Queuine tRNA-ribosyltransferase [Syntrophaceae bacterium PtaU1.Bin231]HOG18316.1 tRNA guanosine(34) transglycosylase Tgt [Syntrophales bacterium]